ncbi:hypothetical protein DKT69_12850 [Micromonospora sicca]|uniref:Uncharacterized protein n=1 Tax=Micromonospora sicca TaxID=2202420 RepID=A0A317DKE1_9ACTN|nr:hypothetical protein [Micromonospora sp. 4G51]PWR15087.1 hypothetical protein DKT69_12850 [Micromonospora sp. 4G51]
MAERPRYGYGASVRPLWSVRDRDAERIRTAPRRVGLRDFGERHPDRFAVEGANVSLEGPEPFAVSYCGASAGVVVVGGRWAAAGAGDTGAAVEALA